jgi:hypothetical protein
MLHLPLGWWYLEGIEEIWRAMERNTWGYDGLGPMYIDSNLDLSIF